MNARSSLAPRTRPRRRGFTLLEVVIASSIVLLIGYGIAASTLSARRAYQGGMIEDALVVRAQRAVNHIADAVAMSGTTSFSPVPSPTLANPSLRFRDPAGWNANLVVWGATTLIEFRYRPTDPDDGRDNDGNGFIDDGEVVMVLDVGTAAERTTRIASNVAEMAPGETFNGRDDDGDGITDERGLNFRLDGNQLTISLTLLDRDGDGRDTLRTATTAVTLRN